MLHLFSSQLGAPPRARSRFLPGCGLAFTLAWSTSTLAQGGSALRAELEAPEGCPDADWFLREILRRAPDARPAAAAEPAKRYRAVVRRESADFAGVVESETLAGTDASTARAKTCEEVVTALAMTIALSLDPDPIEATPRAASSASPAPPAAPPALIATPPAYDHANTPMPRSTPSWSVYAEGQVLGVGVPLLVGGSASVSWRSIEGGAWSPAFRFGGGFLARQDAQQVELRMPFATFDACPSRVELGALWLTPCVHNIVGLMRGEAQTPRADKPATLPFGASGLEARLEWAAAPVLLGARASVLGVWSAPTFRSQPSGTALLQVDLVAVDAGLGVGLVF